MTVSLQGQPACGTAGPRPPPGLPRAGPPASGARAPRGQRGSTTWSAVVCDGPSRGCCAAGCEDGALGQCAVLLADQGGRAGEPTQRVSPGGVLTSSGGEGPATWGQQSLAPRVPSVGCDRLAGGFTPLQLPLASQAPGVRQGRDGPHTGAEGRVRADSNYTVNVFIYSLWLLLCKFHSSFFFGVFSLKMLSAEQFDIQGKTLFVRHFSFLSSRSRKFFSILITFLFFFSSTVNVKWKPTECVNLSDSVLLHPHHRRPPAHSLGCPRRGVERGLQAQAAAAGHSRCAEAGTPGDGRTPCPACPRTPVPHAVTLEIEK